MARRAAARIAGKGVLALKHVLGVSLDEGSAALLCLGFSLGKASVAGALRLPLPGTAEEEAGFLREIGTFVLGNRIPPGVRVVLGVPRAEFLSRRFTTPPVRARALPELVSFELERHLPGKREEFLCGWRVEGRAAGGGHAVHLGAARRAGLDRAAALLARANLPVESILPEPLALRAALRAAEPGLRDALLLHVGAAAVGVDRLRDGRLELSRTFAIAGPLWRESLPAQPAAPPEGLAEQRRAASAALAGQIVGELRRPLFLGELPAGKIPEIRLAGQGANRRPLVEALEAELKVPVRPFSPWPSVRWASPPADLAPWLAPLALALAGGRGDREGLELAEERQEALHRAPRLRLTAALAALLVAVLAAHGAAWSARQRRVLERVEGEIRTLKVKMAEVEAVNRRLQEQRTRLGYLDATLTRRLRQAEVLRELTELVPDDAHLTEYTFREGAVEVTGLSPGASRLLPILEGSPLFGGVEFSAPITAQGGGLERFRIKMRLEAAGG